MAIIVIRIIFVIAKIVKYPDTFCIIRMQGNPRIQDSNSNAAPVLDKGIRSGNAAKIGQAPGESLGSPGA